MKPYVIFGDVTCGVTLGQFMEAMKQEYTEAGALMPDAHAGYSLPIGSAVMTKGAVYPAWVGYDIGCGVTVSRTNLNKEDFYKVDLREIRNEILKVVPVGYNIFDTAGDESSFLLHKLTQLKKSTQDIYYSGNNKAGRSMGTLGGGNHFIEIGFDGEGCINISVHSGSRGFGHDVASYHMAKAANSDRPKEGHFPYTNVEDISDYIRDVSFCQWYATLNRYRIISAVDSVLTKFCGSHTRNVVCNVSHNTLSAVNGGKFIHRKGAIEAISDTVAPIPANMRDGVYIVRGKGNVDSLISASHGAGRVLSRNQAKEVITNEDFAKDMVGIVCDTSGKTDEAPAAYKPINEVMAAQESCVELIDIIKPIINIKG